MERSKSNGIVSISQNANEIQIFKTKFVYFERFAIFWKISLSYLLLPLSIVTTNRQNFYVASGSHTFLSMGNLLEGINFDKEFLITFLSNVRFCYPLVQ